MSSENIKNNNGNSSMLSVLVFPAATTTFGAISSIKRNGGVKQAIKACDIEGFKSLGKSLEPIHKDVFSRSIALAENYDEYKGIAKKAAKLSKKAAKAQNGKISLMDKILNLFRKEKVTPKSIIDAKDVAINKLDDAVDLLKNGKEVVKTSTKSGFKNTAKTLFKNEIKNPIVVALTALEIVPEITGKVIPTFKDKGFLAGIKQTGESLLKVGSNFVSYAAGGAIGRVVGASIGTIICPGVGSAVGANVGDIIGSTLIGSTVTKAVDKIVGDDEIETSESINQEQISSSNVPSEQLQENQQVAQQTSQQDVQNVQVEQNQQTSKESLIKPSFEEARAMYATSTPQLGKSTVKKGYQKPQNGVYATQWVNDMAQAKRQSQLNTLS